MRYLLDANMPRSALAALRAFGHRVEHVRDISLGDADDERVAASANEAAAALASRDLDFRGCSTFPAAEHTRYFLISVEPQLAGSGEVGPTALPTKIAGEPAPTKAQARCFE